MAKPCSYALTKSSAKEDGLQAELGLDSSNKFLLVGLLLCPHEVVALSPASRSPPDATHRKIYPGTVQRGTRSDFAEFGLATPGVDF